MRFDGRTAVVTGAGRGIGEATARRLAADGAALVVADIDEAPAREVASAIERDGGRALGFACDVASKDSVDALFGAAVSNFEHVDFLVTCAGILRFNPILDITEDEWNAVIDSHLKGTFLCAQAATRLMVPRQFGKMVLVSSGAAKGYPTRTHYSAAKAGIEALARALAKEVGPSNINVNVVAPGFIETRMPRQHARYLDQDYEAMKERVAAATPLRRVGTPEETAAVIAFLCSEDASYLSGEILSISGGLESR